MIWLATVLDGARTLTSPGVRMEPDAGARTRALRLYMVASMTMIHESDLCDLCYQFTRTVTELRNSPICICCYELIFYVVAYLISQLTSDLSDEVRAKSFP